MIPSLIAELEQSLFTDYWSESYWRGYIELPHVRLWLLTQKGDCFLYKSGLVLTSPIMGYAAVTVSFNEAELIRVGIDPKHQNKGWGRYLLRQVFGDLKRKQGVEIIFLEVDEQNKSAIHLYLTLNCVEYHVRKNYYKHGNNRSTNALLMRLHLKDFIYE